MPAHLTDRVIAELADDPAVSGLTLLAGASIKPPGDVVEADVAHEGGNAVLERLFGLGVHRTGTVQVDPVPTWVSADGFAAEQRTPGNSADAVVWADVAQRSYDDSELNWTYLSS
jgi:hypothetical protein